MNISKESRADIIISNKRSENEFYEAFVDTRVQRFVIWKN